MSKLKRVIKRFTPQLVIDWRYKWLRKRLISKSNQVFANKSPKEIFSQIYSDGWWGKAGDTQDYSSGHGSHLPGHVNPYVDAVSNFLKHMPVDTTVVDLGCGDFNIGSRICHNAGKYLACDIALNVIERNREKFAFQNVEFRCVDMINDDLPSGDVAIIRQVFQHLSNADIQEVLAKLGQYEYLILTEFIPVEDFTPNIDHHTGPLSRMARGINSGVVLTEDPFNLKPKAMKVIAVSDEEKGVLQTIVYKLK